MREESESAFRIQKTDCKWATLKPICPMAKRTKSERKLRNFYMKNKQNETN